MSSSLSNSFNLQLIESWQVSDGKAAAWNAKHTTISSPRRYYDTIVMAINAVTQISCTAAQFAISVLWISNEKSHQRAIFLGTHLDK